MKRDFEQRSTWSFRIKIYVQLPLQSLQLVHSSPLSYLLSIPICLTIIIFSAEHESNSKWLTTDYINLHFKVSHA